MTEPGSAATPLSFVRNAGQTNDSVAYMARGPGHAFYFTADKVVLDFQRGERGVALELHFRDANPNPEIVAERRATGRVNFIRGSERQANLATYQQLRYRNLWPDIDMVLRGQGGALKYEFVVRPGANPSDIRLAYEGADSLSVGRGGALEMGTPLGTLRDQAPRSFQGRTSVDSSYAVSGLTYGFALAGYDKSRTLVIDPGLLYSTYLGGIDEDVATTLDLDPSGNAYVSGQTRSASFPTTPGAYDAVENGVYDVHISKLNASGALVYATYLGGGGDEYSPSLVVGPGGNVYIAGVTTSNDFPTTPGAFDTTRDPGDHFVTKLNAAGSGLDYSTLFPAELADVALAPDGGLCLAGTVTGASSLVGPSAADPTSVGKEGLLAKLNPSGSALDWATFIGGRGDDGIDDVAVDSSGRVFAAGDTTSLEQFPFTPGAYDTTNEGENAFVSKVAADGTTFIYSTLLGTGSSSFVHALDIDSSGHAYVTGLGTVPATPGAYGNANGTFTTKLNPTGTGIVYSARIYGYDIAVDASGAVYLIGIDDGFGVGGPIPTPGAFDDSRDGTDAFVMKLNPSATALAYATYFGGSGSDFAEAIEVAGGGAFVIAGYTNSTDLPTTPGAHDSSFNGVYDAYVAKLQSYDGYPRPKGATPIRLALVTAYKGCPSTVSPNRTHEPPLAYPSCSPPQQESTNATVGTGDSNGKPARMEGYLAFTSILGNPATPADEADLKIDFFLDDVFTATTLEDYPYQLRILFTPRMTDRNSESSAMATTQDYLFPLFANCAPTADDLEGSTCSLSTTVESIVGPGTILEGKRSMWSIDNVRVFDAGADGDASVVGDNQPFARPGIFVP